MATLSNPRLVTDTSQDQVNQSQPSLLAPKRSPRAFDGYMAEELDKVPWINRGTDDKGWVAGSGPYKGRSKGEVTSMIRNTWQNSPEIRSKWDNVAGGGLDTEQDRQRDSIHERKANEALTGQSYKPGSTAGSQSGIAPPNAIPSPGNSWGAGIVGGGEVSTAPSGTRYGYGSGGDYRDYTPGNAGDTQSSYTSPALPSAGSGSGGFSSAGGGASRNNPFTLRSRATGIGDIKGSSTPVSSIKSGGIATQTGTAIPTIPTVGGGSKINIPEQYGGGVAYGGATGGGTGIPSPGNQQQPTPPGTTPKGGKPTIIKSGQDLGGLQPVDPKIMEDARLRAEKERVAMRSASRSKVNPQP